MVRRAAAEEAEPSQTRRKRVASTIPGAVLAHLDLNSQTQAAVIEALSLRPDLQQDRQQDQIAIELNRDTAARVLLAELMRSDAGARRFLARHPRGRLNSLIATMLGDDQRAPVRLTGHSRRIQPSRG